MWSHPPSTKRFVTLPLLAILVLNVALAGAVMAAPQIWVSSADLDRDATLVGEPVDVAVQMHNNGDDGGAISVEITANGSDLKSERVQVDAQSDKEARIPITISEPGTYEIRAEGKSAGTLTVSRLRAASVDERTDGRTVLLRAGATTAGEELTADLPASENGSFDLRQVRMTGSGSAFNRSVATYAPPRNASFSVPDDDSASVVGAIDMDSLSDVETTSLTVAIDREAIRDTGIETDDVGVYRKTDDGYEPVTTEQTSVAADTITYEATTDGGSQFVVGSLAPSFSVQSQQLSTGNAADGKRVNLTATVANDGHVAGEYTAEMRVDGSTVDEQSVSIPAGGSVTVVLEHVLTAQGDYSVALGDQSVGSVVLTSDDASTDEPTDAEETPTDGPDETDDGSPLDAAPSLPTLGGVGMIEFAIGAGIVVVGGGLLLLLRR